MINLFKNDQDEYTIQCENEVVYIKSYFGVITLYQTRKEMLTDNLKRVRIMFNSYKSNVLGKRQAGDRIVYLKKEITKCDS